MLDLFTKAQQRIKNYSTTAAGAGNIDCNVQPGAGQLWIPQSCVGYHVSGGARVQGWYMYSVEDAALQYLTRPVSQADYTIIPWDGYTSGVKGFGHLPPVLSSTRYLAFRVVATGAGDIAYARVAYLCIRGVQGT